MEQTLSRRTCGALGGVQFIVPSCEPGSQQSHTNFDLTLSQLRTRPISDLTFVMKRAPHVLYNSIVANTLSRLLYTSHPNMSAFQMSGSYCLAVHVEPRWLLSAAEQTSSLFNVPQLGSHECIRDSCH